MILKVTAGPAHTPISDKPWRTRGRGGAGGWVWEWGCRCGTHVRSPMSPEAAGDHMNAHLATADPDGVSAVVTVAGVGTGRSWRTPVRCDPTFNGDGHRFVGFGHPTTNAFVAAPPRQATCDRPG